MLGFCKPRPAQYEKCHEITRYYCYINLCFCTIAVQYTLVFFLIFNLAPEEQLWLCSVFMKRNKILLRWVTLPEKHRNMLPIHGRQKIKLLPRSRLCPLSFSLFTTILPLLLLSSLPHSSCLFLSLSTLMCLLPILLALWGIYSAHLLSHHSNQIISRSCPGNTAWWFCTTQTGSVWTLSCHLVSERKTTVYIMYIVLIPTRGALSLINQTTELISSQNGFTYNCWRCVIQLSRTSENECTEGLSTCNST